MVNFGGMGNIGNMMKQAQKMQERLAKMQGELAERTVEASSGGGMVTVVVNGSQELVSIKIDPEVINSQEADMLEDLVVAAVNEGLRKVREMMSEEMAKITGGIKIPGLL